MANEQEFKWAADGPQDFKLFLSEVKTLARVCAPAKQNIRDVYYDSDDKYYSKNKISCRIRRQDGAYTLTLKGMSKIVNGLAVRSEKNITLKSQNLKTACAEAKKYLPSKNIQKIFSINNKRTVYIIKNKIEAELCFDNFFITAGAKKLHRYEIELELKKGNTQNLKTFATVISQKTKLNFATVSKVAGALRLLKSSS
ncbi:inorganic triphosphatase YgiF [Elusimicrobium simillimum]|uniref:CYTH domain-containing protein n=1 Tax=Elusimicrobium simillimum TaxID=3143438 RepID=UPI003C6FD7C1